MKKYGKIANIQINEELLNSIRSHENYALRYSGSLKGTAKIKVRNALEDIEKNHNHSLYDEVFQLNQNNLDKTAIFYRGMKVTYSELFEKVDEYTKSLTALGLEKGDEVPMCMANCPEAVYTLLACSYMGVKVNSFGNEFDKDYILKILNSTSKKVVFASDNFYKDIKSEIEKSGIENKVVISLADSLPNNKDPYCDLDHNYYDFHNYSLDYKKDDNSILTQSDFLKLGNGVKNVIHSNSKLDDVFTTTYSSGSTNSTHPKGIVHCNRSYITMGRFHEKDLSNAPSMHGLTILTQLPMHSNTNIMSNITDTLLQGSTIAMEPIYDESFFVNSLTINKPTFCVSSRTFLVKFSKQVLFDNKYDNLKLPFILAMFSAGEPTSPGEEKLINKALRKVRAGTDLLPVPIVLSMAGGDCEHAGIFFTMFKAWRDKLPSTLLKGKGLSAHQMVDTVILDPNGNVLPNNHVGRLYANSPCTMVGYRDNPEATNKFFKIINGKLYGDCSVYASKSNGGRISIKARINDSVPEKVGAQATKITDAIQKSKKYVLSCDVVPIKVGDKYSYVSHIETMPGIAKVDSEVLKKVSKNIKNVCDNQDSVLYRMHSHEESFIPTACGKRNPNVLSNEGIESAHSLDYFVNQDSKNIVKSKVLKRR
jgi:acyl-coenzyme A synthetase/AMP-(fatty) acid ligase